MFGSRIGGTVALLAAARWRCRRACKMGRW
jgi:hypothetical protein